ncbi:MAG: RHS repeat-associated core domain-containing protein [Bacteroidales bacterium]|nr:RHS repeat-associated core domain-containing protein [Bacteroidales bacterium]
MKPNRNILASYGINGSIRKRLDHQTQNTDYYYFNASGNLKACGTDMQISVYGYNSANTRTYKVNMFNANQWVNGQPQPIQPMVQSAMFYPNTYINFTQAGEYTKHYYNGTERICSRLGEQQIPISVENEQELEAYKQDVKQIIYNAIGQHLYDEPTNMQEGDVIPLEYLQPCGNSNAVYYYHPNHLSSTMYVTDMQQSVVQSFLYAPYGDIISEYNPGFNGNVLPNYAFNAKELDEETGMYYYEARYYAPPVFISRDPLMSEKPWLTPYHYCSNNPIGRVDPSGMLDEDNIDKWRYHTDTEELEWISNEGGDYHQIVEFVKNGKDGKLYYDKDKGKGVEYDGYIGEMFNFSFFNPKVDGVISGTLDFASGAGLFLTGTVIGAGMTPFTGGASIPIGTAICFAGAGQAGEGLKEIADALSGYTSNNLYKQQSMVRDFCKAGAYFGVGFLSNRGKGVNFATIHNISSFVVSFGWSIVQHYAITHPTLLKP